MSKCLLQEIFINSMLEIIKLQLFIVPTLKIDREKTRGGALRSLRVNGEHGHNLNLDLRQDIYDNYNNVYTSYWHSMMILIKLEYKYKPM